MKRGVPATKTSRIWKQRHLSLTLTPARASVRVVQLFQLKRAKKIPINPSFII